MSGDALILLFKCTIFSLLALIQVYFYRKLAKQFSGHLARRRRLIALRFALFLTTAPFIALLMWDPNVDTVPEWFIASFIYPFYLWHFTSFVTFLVIVIVKILYLPVRSMLWMVKKLLPSTQEKSTNGHEPQFNPRRRVFLRQGATVIAGVAFTGSAIGALQKDRYQKSFITIPVRNLPDHFDGFTIGFISDIHSSIFMTKHKMQEYAKAVNDLGTDMILVTGDFVNSQAEEVYPFAEAFSELQAPYGVYGVLGNHDYYTRHVDVVAKHVNECGIRLLINDVVPIKKNSDTLYLLGIDDVGSAQRATKLIRQTMAETTSSIPKILMCHRPYYFDEAARQDIDLTLSGHTHGGQIVFYRDGNGLITPARLASPYVAGLYTIGASQMYVSRGIGTVGVPIRINCPPEITKITLVKG